MQFLLTAVLAWLIAQAIKVIRVTIKNKRIVPYSFVASGGMPSSHTALVSALTTKVGVCFGLNSIYFAICAVFALVIMYDAVGVRRAVGIQAKKINEILDGYLEDDEIKDKKLGEILGHTPLEVAGGLLLGIVIGLLF